MPTKILLIETDTILAENLTRLLTRKGLRVRTVSDFPGAHQALEEGVYDVVILEEEIAAEGNGKLFKEAKTRHPHARVILLASSGSAVGSGFEPPLEVFAFLQRPFRWDDLIEKIKEASAYPFP